MRICRIALDVANNMSAVGAKWYEVNFDEKGIELGRTYIPGSTRLWTDPNAQTHNSALIPSVILYTDENEQLNLDRDYLSWDAIDLLKDPGVEARSHSNIKYRYFVKRQKYGNDAADFKRLMEYLMKCVSLAPEEEPDAYEISISYPVICSEADKGALKALIAKVWLGLKNRKRLIKLEMVDEAECALRFALQDKAIAAQLCVRLSEKREQLVLVADIGGSTMELCLYRFYAQDEAGMYERLQILRADDDAGRGLGSHQVEKL